MHIHPTIIYGTYAYQTCMLKSPLLITSCPYLERCSNLEFEAIKNVMYHFLSASGLVGFNTYEAETKEYTEYIGHFLLEFFY